jgi:4-hydroxybutyrate CoA-transferase
MCHATGLGRCTYRPATAELQNVEITHLHTEGTAPYANPALRQSAFRVNVFFVGKNVRPHINETNVQYIPMFLSEIPLYMRSGKFPVDVALVQVSPPDAHGFCSLGISVDIAKAACDMAQTIVALVNPNMPRSLGDSFIHQSKITAAVYSENAIYECSNAALTATENAIGRHVAALVEDGATLQMGIGGIPNAVLSFLGNHKNLGVHTEMFSDGILPLVSTLESSTVKQKQNIPAKLFLLLLWAPESSTTLFTIIRRWPCWMWRMSTILR